MIYGCASKPLDSQRLAADFSSDLALISAGKNLLVTLDVFGYIRCIKKQLVTFHHRHTDPELQPAMMCGFPLKIEPYLDRVLGLKHDLKWISYILKMQVKLSDPCTALQST